MFDGREIAVIGLLAIAVAAGMLTPFALLAVGVILLALAWLAP